MLGQLIDPFYPPIQERQPLPWFYMPGTFGILWLGYSVGPGTIRSSVTSLALLALVLLRPAFTLGSVSKDYSLSGIPILWLLLFVDLGTNAYHPRYVGKPAVGGGNKPAEKGSGSGSGSDSDSGVGFRDLKTWPQRLKWAARLAGTTRGIGWDWQVKNVPANPDAGRSRWAFVGLSLLDFARRSALRALAVYGIGFCQTVQPSVAATSPVLSRALDVVINWCGGVWGWQTIGLSQAGGSAVAVALGLSEPWECPPMLDSLSNAWSVRQMWR